MRTLLDHLTSYAEYHRDRRNIATHYAGVPVIVLSFLALLSRPALHVGAYGFALSPAVIVIAAATVFYLKLDARFGMTMGALLLLAGWGAAHLAALSTLSWLGASLGLFVAGWIVQFIGHVFEGRKPAFVDDLVGLAIGPIFIVAETAFALGLRPEVQHAIEAVAGKTRSGRPAASSVRA